MNPTSLFLQVCYPWGNLCPNNLRFPKERELPALLSSCSDSKEYIDLFFYSLVAFYSCVLTSNQSVKITSAVCPWPLDRYLRNRYF